jgi:protein-L-isoaspartate(D-aspartate) O-methyltransferase
MRAHMVDSQLRTNGVTDPRLVGAFSTVARENFVSPERAGLAYADAPIPAVGGGALNPPLVTARLFVEANLSPGEKLLIIGAAPAYAAAIAEHLGCDATTDSEQGPFDAILIDGAIEYLPDALADALEDGGRVVCGLLENGVTRLASGVKRGGRLALRPFADHDVLPVPGFERPKVFSF